MAKKPFKPSAEAEATLRASGSLNKTESLNATREIAKSLELPLREGILSGDILNGIFEPIKLINSSAPEFPLSFLSPGTEKEFVAYSIPNHGYIPQRHVEGDSVMVNTFDIGSAIDWNLKYARDARWDVVGAARDVLEASFVKKINDDGFATVIAAGANRNIVVSDSDAVPGQFTTRFVSMMKLLMRRNGGGNSTSINRGKLTDLYVSPEAMEGVRDWNVDQIDDMTRRQIFLSEGDDAISRIFGVNLHTIDELGEGQEYQLFFEDQLGGVLQGGDVEIIVGLDLSRNNSFVMPIREEVTIFEDDQLHRQKRAGLYGWAEHGMAVLDNRRVLIGSI